MGDTVLLIPSLRALRKEFPQARLVALGTNINGEIFKQCSYIDETMVLDIKELLLKPWKILRVLRNQNFYVALDFDQWLRLSPILGCLSGAKQRLGFKTAGQSRHHAYTKSIEHQIDRHELNCFLDILKPLGINDADETLEYRIDALSEKKAEAVLKESGLDENDDLIIFHPETPAHGGQRQWPESRYIELGKRITNGNKWKLLVGGTRQDWENNRKMAEAMGPFAFALPPVSLKEYAAIIAKARLLVCGNTGVMHLASALGTPLIALHGPTNPVKWGPRGKSSVVIQSKKECSPCLYLGFEYGCRTNKCMEAIDVDEVASAVTKLIAKR